jgi:hypothetical protein
VVTEVPFSKNRSGVAFAFENFSQSCFPRIEPVSASRPEGTVHTEAIRIATCEKTRSRSRADGLGSVPLCETSTFGSHAIEIGRLVAFRAVDSDISVSLVIGKDDDDVRKSILSREGVMRRENSEENEQGKDSQNHGIETITQREISRRRISCYFLETLS